MVDLYHKRNVNIFLFQDDDYLASGTRARRWASEIADELIKSEAAGKLAYKISCRSDEIREDIVEKMAESGLTHVYLGVESGDEQGLINLNKMMKPETHIKAGKILRKYGLSFDFGFMMLEPESTFQSIRNNIDFLEEFIGDGWSGSLFCRMLPYAGTPIRDQLLEQGRLKGTKFEPDYGFLDPKIDMFYQWMLRTFNERNFSSHGLCHILRGLLFQSKLKLKHQSVRDHQNAQLRYFASVCNKTANYALRTALDHIESTSLDNLLTDSSFLDGLTLHEKREEKILISQLTSYQHGLNKVSGENQILDFSSGWFDKTWTIQSQA